MNIYLKNNNLLIHATGTNDKAFLNLTWRMSVKEVERANETNLVFRGSGLQGGMDQYINCIFGGNTREEKLPKNIIYSCYEDRVYIFGELSEVEYHFFDNEFYEYRMSTPVDGYSDAEKILKALEQRFGKQYTENTETISNHFQNKDIQQYTLEWVTPKEKASFSFDFPKNKLKEVYYNFNDKDRNMGYISVDYLPMLEIIEKKTQKEHDSYF